MKILKAIGAAVLAVATCFSARAEETLVKTPLILDGVEAGYTVTGLPNDEVAVVFTNHVDGAMTWTAPTYLENVQFLVVAGGGSGRAGTWGGGGGGGGVVTGLVNSISKKAEVVALVGEGGAKASGNGTAGSPGRDSYFSVAGIEYVRADGGGNGKGGNGASGGSGGGAGPGTTQYYGGSATQGSFDETYITGWKFGEKGGDGIKATTSGGGGGGATTAGSSPSAANKGGVGGAGLTCDITGQSVVYGSGGGGGGSYTGGSGGSGAGRGASGTSTEGTSGVANRGGGGGGGGQWQTNYRSGAGGSGIVVLRYSIPAGTAIVPTIGSKAYNGTLQIADVEDCDGYTVTKNDGGTEGGEYDVVLTLNDGYSWDEEGAGNPLTLKFAITQAENAWTAAPSITVPEWFKGAAEIGSITPAATQFGNVAVTITKDGEPFTGDYTDLSTFEAGSYVVTFTAPAECSSYTAITEEPTKTVSFIVYAAGEVPEYTLTLGDMTVKADRSVSVPYSLACEVATEYVADVYAAYAIEGSDTTNTYALATGVALTSSGTGSIPDLKPGVNYYVSFYATVEDEQCEPTTPVVVAIPGAATGLTASATFTNDPMKFIVSGSVVPGIGTTTVTINWAINNTETLDNAQTISFQYGDEGTFSFEIPYTSLTDKLTYAVTVQNTVEAHGDDFTWNSALDATTKSRADAANITYTWTGEGDDNLWTNIENWTTTATESFGYPDSSYAKAYFNKSGIVVNLNGRTIKLRGGQQSGFVSQGLVFAENLGEIVLRNGTFEFAEEYAAYGFGSRGTRVVFDSVRLMEENSTHFRMRFRSGSAVIFSGTTEYDQYWSYEPWGTSDTRLVVRDGEMRSSFYGTYIYKNEETIYKHYVDITNATWTIKNDPDTDRLAYYMTFRDGVGENGRQARLIVSAGSMRLTHTYDIKIPEGGHEDASITAPAKNANTACTFKLDVSDYKSGKPVPLVRYTSSTDQALSTDNLTLAAYEDGVNVTAKRNARLVWSGEDNTLYYKQDSQTGFSIIIR